MTRLRATMLLDMAEFPSGVELSLTSFDGPGELNIYIEDFLGLPAEIPVDTDDPQNGASRETSGQLRPVSRTLASAEPGDGRGTARLSADLELRVPTSAPPGTYQATVTFTAI